MKKIVRILVVEDNRYFNCLLLQELRNCVNSDRFRTQFRFIFHTFTDTCDFEARLNSPDLNDAYSIAFIDYYLGNEINGSHILKMLRERSAGTSIVLLSQSKSVKDEVSPASYDYFVPKDSSTVALCRLCLEQFLENRYL